MTYDKVCEECGGLGTEDEPLGWHRDRSGDYFLLHARCNTRPYGSAS